MEEGGESTLLLGFRHTTTKVLGFRRTTTNTKADKVSRDSVVTH
jgi:hypothetical protein